MIVSEDNVASIVVVYNSKHTADDAEKDLQTLEEAHRTMIISAQLLTNDKDMQE